MRENPKDLIKRLDFLEAKMTQLESKLEMSEDKRKMQAILVPLNEVLLHMEGPIVIQPKGSGPSCLICSEEVKSGEWLFSVNTRSVLDMSPIIENADGRSDEDLECGLRIRHVHRKCFLEAILNDYISPDEDEAHVADRLADPRYQEPSRYSNKDK